MKDKKLKFPSIRFKIKKTKKQLKSTRKIEPIKRPERLTKDKKKNNKLLKKLEFSLKTPRPQELELRRLEKKIEKIDRALNELIKGIKPLASKQELGDIESKLKKELSKFEKTKDITIKHLHDFDKVKEEFKKENREVKVVKKELEDQKFTFRKANEFLSELTRKNSQFLSTNRGTLLELEKSARINTEALDLVRDEMKELEDRINNLDDQIKIVSDYIRKLALSMRYSEEV